MCGIAGVLNSKSERVVVPDTAERLRAALNHRGPDDSGVWSSPEGAALFVHTRLSILDLSQAGHQPMHLDGGRFTITFNGEIYNFRELRGVLETQGTTFRTHTDTEVILRLYERYGAACVEKLRGMFAFAIWDALEKSCFIARDALGIKPLYYSVKEGRLAFASELKALQAAGLTGSEIDPQAVCDYFETGSVPEPHTLIKDAWCLKPGHTLRWQGGRLQTQRYWEPEFPVTEVGDPVKKLRESLLDTVSHHFVSDVPVGIFLSGGIDSTALLALARETGHERVSTFSIGVDDPALDESGSAVRSARHFGSDHHEMRLDTTKGRAIFEEYVQSIDQPSIDGFNTYTVSSFARQHGMKVVLSGLGGDEIFAGYSSFTQVPRLARIARLMGILPGARQKLGSFMESRLSAGKLRRLGSFFQSDPCVSSAFRTYRAIYSRRDAQSLTAHYTGATNVRREPRPVQSGVPTPEDEVSRCELTRYMRNQLLKDSDVMSMAHSLELRVPFVDRTFFDAVATVPAAVRLRQGKKFLLDAVPELPAWVVNQPKRGFVFPFQAWASASWGEMFEKPTVPALPGLKLTWYQKWSVFMLEHWLRRAGLSHAGE
jgi:asparagine synthase (glutamine-hydrolysing)